MYRFACKRYLLNHVLSKKSNPQDICVASFASVYLINRWSLCPWWNIYSNSTHPDCGKQLCKLLQKSLMEERGSIQKAPESKEKKGNGVTNER